MSSDTTDHGEVEAVWLRQGVTTTTEALDAVEIGIDVADASLFEVDDICTIEHEQVQVVSIASSTLTVTRAYQSTTATTHATGTSIGVFRRRRFHLSQPLQPQAVDRFPGKVTIGEYSKDSNDILSAWIISDLTGGHGIADHQEGVDDNRYRFGNLYTRYIGQWSLPFAINVDALGSGRIIPLGDQFYNDIIHCMIASEEELFQDEVSVGNMSGPPYDVGVSFSGTAATPLFYVPLSVSGYSTFNPATNALTNNNAAGDPDARSFLLWDEKLLCLDLGGYMWYATTAAATTTFTHYTLGGNNIRLDAAYDPYRLHPFYNRQGEQVPYAITHENVWAFDADTPRFYRIPDFESRHPRFGTASCVWKGELYVSSGMDLLAFNGDVIRNVGLSRDDGLPFVFQGYIRGLAPTQNSLYALVVGASAGGFNYLSVHEYSGIGWHCIFTDVVSPEVANRIGSTACNDGYQLLWGLSDNGVLYSQDLPVSFTNPREAIEHSGFTMGDFTTPETIDGLPYYTADFYLDSGRFDANMQGYRKIANGIEFDIRSIESHYETVQLFYRIDHDSSYTALSPQITDAGHHSYLFGHVDPEGHYTGLDFEQIELRFAVTQQYPNPYIQSTSLVIESAVFSFLKLMNPALAWTAVIDGTDTYHDAAPEVIASELTELRTLPNFFTIKHRSATYRARMTGQNGTEEGGQDTRGLYQVSLLQISEVLGVSG